MEPSVALVYSIAYASPHSGSYAPNNILVDSPADHSSRWSGAHQGPAKQCLILRLKSLAVVKSITFGKHSKPHPCNMKEFKVYIGMSEDNMTEVLAANLKNDIIPETFSIRHTNRSLVEFPTRYVKIVPLSAHSPGFHLSIWFVSMTGISDPVYIDNVQRKYEEFLETAALRLALKHLRQRRLLTPYNSILERSGLQMEHPLVSELYDLIVIQGKWEDAEKLLVKVSTAGLFNDYLRSCEPHAIWERLRGTNPDGDVPCARGGHAMCIDTARGIIYLFGGWDGSKSLDDFWAYHISNDKWEIICTSTSRVKCAPPASSCHKMVFDSKTGSIYVFGRLSDTIVPKPNEHNEPPAELYRYHTTGIDTGKWDCFSFHPSNKSCPPLIYDHQMVMDCEAQILYVFGGKVVEEEKSSSRYSGLYSFSVQSKRWTQLQLTEAAGKPVPSRFGHSMVFEPTSRSLFIFAGQRDDKYLSDMYTYDIEKRTTTELYSNFTTAGGPEACFTQRAVIDHQLNELYIVSGLTRASSAGSLTKLSSEQPSWIFRYNPRPGQWVRVNQAPRSSQHSLDTPMPRYAHQMVYDPNSKTIFMHGGNAGFVGAMEHGGGEDGQDVFHKESRLDDFWRMTLVRPDPTEITRKAKFRIRQQQFREMGETMPQVKALTFLQTEVSSVVDHSDPAETEIFRSLLTHLLTPRAPVAVEKTYPSEHEDSPPRKRSRANTPEDDAWTSTNDLVCKAALKVQEASRLHCVDARMLREQTDPVETGGEMDADRFKQRTDLFEQLLEYVSVNAKQPDGNLIDLVDADS
ncbi:hypothetical protein BDZ89DRAFT_1065702 [Hymenopellis radicata]|nr:hypothetical protein BDZ89DRAFT_1065702 [Hymenopellis radicata]